MDIGSLYSDYLTQTATKASNLERTLSGNNREKSDDELLDACKQFEAYFYEQELEVDVEDAGRPVGALDIAPDPEERFGDAAQHGRPPCCCCSCCSVSGPESRGA